ncbi:hypothetical protein NEAUS06_2181 [Nematocida ausubeli]|nr:hypothetical protein NEAUS06_2181 [Nematocida ausubeli]
MKIRAKRYLRFAVCAAFLLFIRAAVAPKKKTVKEHSSTDVAESDIDIDLIDSAVGQVIKQNKSMKVDIWENFFSETAKFIIFTKPEKYENQAEEGRVVLDEENSIDISVLPKTINRDKRRGQSVDLESFGLMPMAMFTIINQSVIQQVLNRKDKVAEIYIKNLVFIEPKKPRERCLFPYGFTEIKASQRILKQVPMGPVRVETENPLRAKITKHIIKVYMETRRHCAGMEVDMREDVVKKAIHKNINVYLKYMIANLESILPQNADAEMAALEYIDMHLTRDTHIVRKTVCRPLRVAEKYDTLARRAALKKDYLKKVGLNIFFPDKFNKKKVYTVLKMFLFNVYLRIDLKNVNLTFLEWHADALSNINRLSDIQNITILLIIQNILVISDSAAVNTEIKDASMLIKGVVFLVDKMESVLSTAYSSDPKNIVDLTIKNIYSDLYKLLAALYEILPYSQVFVSPCKEKEGMFFIKENFELTGKGVLNRQRYLHWEATVDVGDWKQDRMPYRIKDAKCTEQFYTSDGSTAHSLHYHVHYVDNVSHRYHRICVPYYCTEDSRAVCVHTASDIAKYIHVLHGVPVSDIHTYVRNGDTHNWSFVKSPHKMPANIQDSNHILVFYYIPKEQIKNGFVFLKFEADTPRAIKLPLFLSPVELAISCNKLQCECLQESILHSLELSNASPLRILTEKTPMWKHLDVKDYYSNLCILVDQVSVDYMGCLIMNASLVIDSTKKKITWRVKYPYSPDEYNYCVLSDTSMEEINPKINLMSTVERDHEKQEQLRFLNIETAGTTSKSTSFHLEGNEILKETMYCMSHDEFITWSDISKNPSTAHVEIIQTDPSYISVYSMHMYFMSFMFGYSWM